MADLKDIRNGLLRFPRNPKKYNRRKIFKFDTTFSPGVKQITHKLEIASPTTKGKKTKTFVQFNKINFQKEQFSGSKEATLSNGSVWYHDVPTLDDVVKLKCSCFTADTLIPIVGQEPIPIKDLVGKDSFSVYSYDLDKNKIVTGEGYNCEIKEKNVSIIEVMLDNDKTIKCTVDHEFLTKSGVWIKAKNLLPGTSLESMYTRNSDQLEVYSESGWFKPSTERSDDNFYNYIYLDPSKKGNYKYQDIELDSEPFYVGKGKGNRCNNHLNPSDDNVSHLANKVRKLKREGIQPLIVVRDNLLESVALDNERHLIAMIGRRDLNKGPLINKTDGLDRIKKSIPTEAEQIAFYNHKVVSIKHLKEKQDVYCFTVKSYGNFILDTTTDDQSLNGIVVKQCPDFRFTFEKELFDAKALVGNWRRYTRKTSPPPKGLPFRNPKKVMGFCKHVWAALNMMKQKGLIK